MATDHRYVFLSYSSRNYEAARELKNFLNINNIDCWMAPGSIPAGSDYATEIPEAIGGCAAFILLLSKEAQASNWVPKELDLAISRGRRVIPFQIDDADLSAPFEFRLTNVQRTEAYGRYEEAARELVMELFKHLGIRQDAVAGQTSPVTDTIGAVVPGRIIGGKYRILREIARGGMTVVYLAADDVTYKTWAIKVVSKKPDNIKIYSKFKPLLSTELWILSRLRHVSIPYIVDVMEDDRVLLVVMEYIEGTSLNRYIDQHGAVEEARVIDWARQLCSVLDYMHSQKPAIIHNDIKPMNIMLKPDGKLVLIDFGVAREYTDGEQVDRTMIGTLGYTSPEQVGGIVDGRSDIYAMGATLYHLITGRSPAEPPYGMYPIRQFNPQLSYGMEYVIDKCTKRDPDERYQTAQEVLADLDRIDELSAKLKRKAFFRNIFRFK